MEEDIFRMIRLSYIINDVVIIPLLPRPMIGYMLGLPFVQLAVWNSIGSV